MRAHELVSAFAKGKERNSFPSVSRCLEPIVQTLAESELLKKKKKHSICYFSGNLIQDGRLRQCAVPGLCSEKGFRKGSAHESRVRVCV